MWNPYTLELNKEDISYGISAQDVKSGMFSYNIIHIDRSDHDLSGGVFVFVKSFKLQLQQDI